MLSGTRSLRNDLNYTRKMLRNEKMCAFRTMFLNEMFNIGRMFDGQILDVELESGECTFEKGV